MRRERTRNFNGTALPMFFPYNTDAPIYYWPIVTVSMIVVNIVVFAWEIANPEIVEIYALAIGDGLHPIQWLTNNFLHAGFLHLFGNMLALWAFGLVVEGKLGPWKTLVVYLGIGTLEGFIVQLLMLGHEATFCLGASTIVFGVMAISLIWAPENKMDCILILWFRPFCFVVQIQMLVGLFVALEILLLYNSGGTLSSEFMHVVGAMLGFAVGITLLKTGLVDCEHWDIFSVWAGRHLLTPEERARAYAETTAGKREAEERELRRQEKVVKQLDMILTEVRFALQEKKPLPAFHAVKRIANGNPQWMLPEPELLQLIQLLTEKVHYWEAVEAIHFYLKHYEAKKSLVQMKLAQTYLLNNQPRTALKTLLRIDQKTLDATQLRYYQNLRTKLESMQAHNTYELAGDV